MTIPKFEIAKLELKAGDILVIRTLENYSLATIQKLSEHFRNIVPDGVRGILIDKGVEVSVIHPEVNP